MNDDLVSVDPDGKVAVEKGSHGGRGIYWVLIMPTGITGTPACSTMRATPVLPL